MCPASVHVPLQEFENSLDAWMAEFHTYMTLDCPPALAESDPEKQSVVDAVKATVGGWGKSGWVGGRAGWWICGRAGGRVGTDAWCDGLA
jgi:hypothetical protein